MDTLGHIRSRAGELGATEFTLLQTANVANRGLLILGPSLYLIERYKTDWPEGEETIPAPTNIIELRDTGVLSVGVTDFQLPRVQVDGSEKGFWYDGSNFGLRIGGNIPAGEFRTAYYRYPKMLDGVDATQKVEGGEMVAAMLVNFIVADFYLSLGDEESRILATPFQQAFEQMQRQLALSRSRAVNVVPSKIVWRNQ